MKAALMLAAALCCAIARAQAPAAVAPSATAERLQQIAAAADSAQKACHGRIHHDTYAFESCLLDLLRTEPRSGARRLGITYFGYVGAMNSDRMGMLGAQVTAYEFLGRFRRLQKELKLDDLSLCRTVAGDCDVRIARIRLMEQTPAAQQRTSVRDVSAEHQHQH